MKPKFHLLASLVLAASSLVGAPAVHAQTLRIANQGDLLSLDPHSLNESLQLGIMGNVYEALVGRNKDLSLAPLLAASWKQTSPTVWRFELRKDVQFHDGTPFTADDVVFSFVRAAGVGSDLRSSVSVIQEVRKIDDHIVEIETRGPFPILPDTITQLMVMSRKWCDENQSTQPADRGQGSQNTASSKTNGTGPYIVRERQANVRTVFQRNPTYWGKIDGNAQEVVFTPIPDPVLRAAALVSGEVDVAEPMPVEEIQRINASPGVRVVSGPELSTLFLGMDQQRDELPGSDIKGRNPFKDKRVRQAFYQAIDIAGIQRAVMRGMSRPAALPIGTGINGWTAAQDKRLPFDAGASKKLLAEAGYPNGFQVTLNCPSGRYVNDARICETVAANLSKVGVQVRLAIEPKSAYFSRLLRRDSSFYLLGWTPATYDAHEALVALAACPDDKGNGQANFGGYCNPRLDALISGIQSETDKVRRSALIGQALAIYVADIGSLPLHQQSLAWGVSKRVELTQMPDNAMPFKWMSIKR